MAKHCTYRQVMGRSPATLADDVIEHDLEDGEVVIDVDQFDNRVYLLVQKCVEVPDAVQGN